MVAGRLRQLKLLLWKNWLFIIRSWKSTFLQLLAPCFFLLLVIGASYIPPTGDDTDPEVTRLGRLPKCEGWNGKNCTSLLVMAVDFSNPLNPSDEMLNCIREIMTEFAAVTHLKLNEDIRLYLTPAELMELFQFHYSGEPPNITNVSFTNYFVEHTNQTQAGLIFMDCKIDGSSSKLNYTIMYNSSRSLRVQQLIFGSPNKPDGRTEIAILVDSIFIGKATGRKVNVTVDTADFPLIYQRESVAGRQASIATLFLFCAITFQFIMMMYNVVSEKDLKLRQGLKLIGLKDSIYWLSWTITGVIIALLSTIILMVTGYACQMTFFLNTNFLINFLLFFIYSCSMVPLAFFASVFINTVRQAVNAGMLVFVVGLFVIMLLSNPFILTQLYENVPQVVILLSFLPPFHLAKAMGDIGIAGSNTDINGLPQQPYHFGWNNLTTRRNVTVFNLDFNSSSSAHYFLMPPTYESYVFLVLNGLLYGVLAWYLDAVVRGNHGIPRKLYFPFQPSYWFDWLPCWSNQTRKLTVPVAPAELQVDDSGSDTDEQTEDTALIQRDNLRGGVDEDGCALKIHGLKKVFHSSTCFCCSRESNVAVNQLSLNVREHQILALLGHNGAGKSTTINMLTGLLEPDEGDAYFYGLSVRQDLDAVHTILGVCPQHDILWGDLTAQEHMELFANLKAIPADRMADDIRVLLEEVQLIKVAKHRVKTFSGGMRRRLSVALSFLGDPKVLFLDEPTTGMDPQIRREIWNLILRMKHNRVTIMTTHSMEEADILGDNIAIMATGQLKVMGTSVKLKNIYAGYNVELVVRRENVPSIMDLVRDRLPGATLKSEPIEVEGGGVLLPYNLPPDRHTEIVPFFKVIDGDRRIAEMIQDYSISQTTLEEVFLKVTLNEYFQDQQYQPVLMRSHSYTASSPTKETVSNSL